MTPDPYDPSLAAATLPPAVERALGPALKRGWRRRCPNCGAGPMLKGFLAVRDACPACAEPLHHQRADDGPAYITVLIVGHVIAPLLLWTYSTFRPDPLVLATGLTTLSLTLSIILLPRLKAMMIAFQWAKRMHGFGSS